MEKNFLVENRFENLTRRSTFDVSDAAHVLRTTITTHVRAVVRGRDGILVFLYFFPPPPFLATLFDFVVSLLKLCAHYTRLKRLPSKF